MYRRGGKRLIDVAVSATGLILLSPLLLVLAVLTRRKLGSPILFRQKRPGLGGRPFTLLKFRTMTETRTSDGHIQPDADRLTTYGEWLRSTSLDELPELFNVLRGDMSLVGPRPLLVEYLPRYSAEQSRRHNVRPGLTGWAQVNGRNTLSWPQRFSMDVWYANNVSFGLDVRIAWRTVSAVVSRRGISPEGDVTMPPFSGNE
jgi:sugar transferase EpsL